MPSRTLIVHTRGVLVGLDALGEEALDLEVLVGDEQRLEERADAHLAVRVALHLAAGVHGEPTSASPATTRRPPITGSPSGAGSVADCTGAGRCPRRRSVGRRRRRALGLAGRRPCPSPSGAVSSAVASPAWCRWRPSSSSAPPTDVVVLLVRAGRGDQPEADGRRPPPCPALPVGCVLSAPVPLVVVLSVVPRSTDRHVTSSAVVTPVTTGTSVANASPTGGKSGVAKRRLPSPCRGQQAARRVPRTSWPMRVGPPLDLDRPPTRRDVRVGQGGGQGRARRSSWPPSPSCRSGCSPSANGPCSSCSRRWTPAARTASSARVLTGINPAGVRGASFGVPSDEEPGHDFLWRIHHELPAPRADRRVQPQPLRGRARRARQGARPPEARGGARYEHIRDFERMLVDEGTAIVKLYLHISDEEQRQAPAGSHRQPRRAVEVPPRATSTTAPAGTTTWPPTATRCARRRLPNAPWYVVPGDRKWVRNLAVAKILRHALERLDPQYPDAEAHGHRGSRRCREGAGERRGRAPGSP